MTRTPDLIDTLVDCATPVRRLWPPVLRAALWLLFAVLVLGLLAIVHGVRPDFAERLQQPVFVIGMAGALATGILAAIASSRSVFRTARAGGFCCPRRRSCSGCQRSAMAA